MGVLGGLVGACPGFLLGTYLVDRFGQSMLAGSGGTIVAHFTPSLIVIGAVAGIASGILAMIGPAIRLVRDGPLASMASVDGVQRARTIAMWPLVVGAGALVAAVVVLKIFERGSLPLNVGIYGMTVGLCGVVLVRAWIAPRGAGLLIELLTIARPAVGRLLRADMRRYAVLFALSAALLAQGASSAIGSHSMQLLGATQIAEEKADRLVAGLTVECRRLRAETCAGAPESQGSTWPRSPWAATSSEVQSAAVRPFHQGAVSRDGYFHHERAVGGESVQVTWVSGRGG